MDLNFLSGLFSTYLIVLFNDRTLAFNRICQFYCLGAVARLLDLRLRLLVDLWADFRQLVLVIFYVDFYILFALEVLKPIRFFFIEGIERFGVKKLMTMSSASLGSPANSLFPQLLAAKTSECSTLRVVLGSSWQAIAICKTHWASIDSFAQWMLLGRSCLSVWAFLPILLNGLMHIVAATSSHVQSLFVVETDVVVCVIPLTATNFDEVSQLFWVFLLLLVFLVVCAFESVQCT